MLPWIVGTFLFLLAYLGGVIISIILIGTSRFEILLLLGFAIVEAAIGFYLWVCIVSLFQVNNSTASASSLYADLNTLFRVVQVKQLFFGLYIHSVYTNTKPLGSESRLSRSCP